MISYTLWGLFILTALYLIYTDLRTYCLPNTAVGFVATLGIFHVFYHHTPLAQALFCAALLMGLTYSLKLYYEKKIKAPPLGGGDIKLFGAVGLWLSPQDIPWFLVSVGMAGILWGALWTRILQKRIFPFSPSIYAGYGILCIARVCKWL
ncbi:MAG: prepilin peptidase [Alphaproteobacteria bacterium]|nr:prepilin peptidase [Alphaproteobacteria bacterium]